MDIAIAFWWNLLSRLRGPKFCGQFCGKSSIITLSNCCLATPLAKLSRKAPHSELNIYQLRVKKLPINSQLKQTCGNLFSSQTAWCNLAQLHNVERSRDGFFGVTNVTGENFD
jgi:hypothetical protein